VVRGLCTKLVGAQSERTITHIVDALNTICQAHPSHLGAAVKALESIDPKGHEGICLAAAALLQHAAGAGVKVEQAVKGRFESELAKKLVRPARPQKRRGT